MRVGLVCGELGGLGEVLLDHPAPAALKNTIDFLYASGKTKPPDLSAMASTAAPAQWNTFTPRC
jgi:hypothetical protein